MSNQYDPFLGQPTASILLLGVFHLQDRGLDWHKPQHSFAVFSEQRQREILAVVAQLARYQPTKVAIERTADQQATVDQEYAAYLRDEFTLPVDEIYQLGFRLARAIGHGQVWCVNAWDRHYEPQVDLEAYARQYGQEPLLTEWSPRFKQSYDYSDQQVARQTLQEIFLEGNAEANIIRSHGHYLVEWFKIGVGNEYPGADQVTGWYNRNLRIFANLQRITERPDERILLIIGGGHLPILRHCVQASPEYNLVEVHEYLTSTIMEEPMQPHRTPESFLALFNWTPAVRPLDLRVLDEQQQDGCTRQLIEYTIEEERIQAFLLLPPGQKAKAPGILAIHQDGGVRPYSYGKSEVVGLGGDPELNYGIELCQRGYVVICPDRFPFESRSLANSPFKATFDQFRIFLRLEEGKEIELTEDLYAGCRGNRLQMEDKSPFRLELYEFQRAIDLLCAHPLVDAERIGVIGHSAGGLWSALLMFIDPRVKVGCSSCGAWLLRWNFGEDKLRPINGFGGTERGIKKWGDRDDILAGIAPRPFLETRGDPVTPDEIAELTQKARERYTELGVPERFDYVAYDGGHVFRQDMREKSYAWFDHWFDATI